LAAQESQTLKQEGWRVHKLINGYIRFLRSRTTGDSSRVRKLLPITIPTRTISKTCTWAASTLHRFNSSTNENRSFQNLAWRCERRRDSVITPTGVSEGMVVLDAVNHIQATQANDLACRWNCKAGKCGSCSAEVNGMPKLMCHDAVERSADR
jgi:hypothetical protein